jgi:pyridoxal phosphate enzyme (YggS family)
MDTLAKSRSIISHNILEVQARISQSAVRVGRKPEDVRLVAISKGQSVEKIRAGYEVGIRDFGENRIHEAIPKIDALNDLEDIRWHMVGHVQSRKSRLVPPAFDMVHSVDRMKLAQKLDRFADVKDVRLPALLECNVSGESAKYGWNLQDEKEWSAILPEFGQIIGLGNLEILGLMTMAPWVRDEQVLRSCFKKLRALREFLSDNLPGEWRELSMGMTDDFEYAIEEGATIVRIGRAIFGERNPA